MGKLIVKLTGIFRQRAFLLGAQCFVKIDKRGVDMNVQEKKSGPKVITLVYSLRSTEIDELRSLSFIIPYLLFRDICIEHRYHARHKS